MSKTKVSQDGNHENYSLLGCDTRIFLQDYTASQATDNNINGTHHQMGSQGYSVRSKVDNCSNL